MKSYTSFSDTKDNSYSTQQTLARLLEGICFRYFWATEKLRPEDVEFGPGHGAMNLMEINDHIHDLAVWTHKALDPTFQRQKPESFLEVRASILDIFETSQTVILSMTEEQLSNIRIRDFPFWNMINGPWADVLTHVGQINTYRRMNGNPIHFDYSPFSGYAVKK